MRRDFLLASIVLGILAAVLCTGLAAAGNVFVGKGEGGAGLDAWFELGDTNELTLGMIGCRSRGGRLSLQLGLQVNARNASGTLPAELRNPKDEAKLGLIVCINNICEERNFQFLESGTGDAFFTMISIEQRREAIRLLRIMIPNERTKYEYRGEVESVLRRICGR